MKKKKRTSAENVCNSFFLRTQMNSHDLIKQSVGVLAYVKKFPSVFLFFFSESGFGNQAKGRIRGNHTVRHPSEGEGGHVNTRKFLVSDFAWKAVDTGRSHNLLATFTTQLDCVCLLMDLKLFYFGVGTAACCQRRATN